MAEKQKLQKGKSYTTLTGKVKLSDKSFQGEQTSQTTGYKYVRINFGVETADGNTVYAEMMGGYSPNKPIINAQNKEDNSKLEVNWADRKNPAILDSVADYKFHKMGLTRDEQGKLVIERFLSPIDVEEYLKQHLKQDMEITVKGNFGFSEYNDETQRKFNVQNIFLPYQAKEKDEQGNETGNLLPVQYQATFVQTILLTDDSFKKITSADAKAGEVVVQARVADYVSKKNNKPVKMNMTFPLPIHVKINKDNPEMTAKLMDALFKVKKGKVRELTIEGIIVDGYDKQEVSSADIKLSPEIQELIAMGLYSEEEAKAKMTVRGNKVSKLVFTRPFIQKDKDDATKIKMDINDDKYTMEDIFPVLPENDIKQDSIAGLGEETQETPVDDNAWMSALGV